MALANRIITALDRPIGVRDMRIASGASAGLSFAPWDVRDAKTMIHQSDLALYHAKRRGRGILCAYDSMIELEMQVKAKLEADLNLAVHQNQFFLMFQPIFSLSSGRIAAVEALIRWQHPTRGQISPDEFIKTAEASGLIEPIGRWVITEACRIAISLPAHLIISINLSPLQLRDPKLVELVTKTLEITGLPAERVEFEITESSVLDTDGPSRSAVDALRALGTRFALDDFGTGHSSLSLLHRMRFDRVKIDRSFTAKMLTDDVNRVLVEKVIELSQALEISVTVEGIETEAQLQFLRKYDGLLIQGYLTGRPALCENLQFDSQFLSPPAEVAPAARRSNIVPIDRRLRDTQG